jgi:hypothetical protein
MTTSDRYDQLGGNVGQGQPERRSVLGRSPIFTPEVLNDIHMKAELGRYRMRGFSAACRDRARADNGPRDPARRRADW